LRLQASLDEQREILARVREHAILNKGPVTADALTAIWREIRQETAQTFV